MRNDGQRDAWYECLFEFLGKWYVFTTVVIVGMYLWKGPEAVRFLVALFKDLLGSIPAP